MSGDGSRKSESRSVEPCCQATTRLQPDESHVQETFISYSFPALHFISLSSRAATMSDDEVDLELLNLLRQRLGISAPQDGVPRDTGAYIITTCTLVPYTTRAGRVQTISSFH